jgi:hypothetical protein
MDCKALRKVSGDRTPSTSSLLSMNASDQLQQHWLPVEQAPAQMWTYGH